MNKQVDPIPSSHPPLAALTIQASPAADQAKFDPVDIWYAILEHYLVVGLFLAVGLAVGMWLGFSPKRYSASSSIRLQPDAAQAYKISAAAMSGEDADDKKTNSEVRIMESRTIMLKVAADMNLANNPDFWGFKPKKYYDLRNPDARNRIYKRMLEVVKIVHEPKTEIIDVESTTNSPLLSTNISNDLTNEYITHIFQVRFGSVDRVSKWMVNQLGDLRRSVERDQKELVDLQAKLGVLGLDQKSGAYLLADSLQGITRASSEATINRIMAEAKLQYLQSADPNLIESEQGLLQSGLQNQPNGLLQTLRSSEAVAASDYADLSARFGANYPAVKQSKARLDAITARIQVEQQRIVNQAKLAYDAAASNERMTNRTLTERKDEAFRSRDDMVKYVILAQTYEGDRALYEGLTLKLHEAGINAGLESGQVDIVDLADIPTLARKPLPYQWFVLSVVLFTAVGCTVAFGISRFDMRFHSGEEAEKKLSLPLLAVLPQFARGPSADPFSLIKQSQSHFGEGMQLLRNNVLLSHADGPPNSILVTSSVPGEGKSTVSRNLAAMLAMHGSRVLLIDADLRKPVQHKALGLPQGKGLSGYLSSSTTLEEAIMPVPTMKNLFLIPSGQIPPQPAILLSSSRMQTLVEEAEANFDFVVIDVPPVLAVSDPILCSRLVDAVVLVIRQQAANARSISRVIDMIGRGQGKMVGFVMNGVQNRTNRYGEFYGKYGNYGAEEEKGTKA